MAASQDKMDSMIDESMKQLAEEGVIISVTSISGSATLHEKLICCNGDPHLPAGYYNCIPQTAIILAEGPAC